MDRILPITSYRLPLTLSPFHLLPFTPPTTPSAYGNTVRNPAANQDARSLQGLSK